MRTARGIIAFVVCLLLTALMLRSVQPRQEIGTVTPKLDHVAEHGDEFDVIFLGSSRTFRQVLPEVFDRAMAAAGDPVKSFNLGVDGMRPPEDTYVLEKALATRKKPLKWLFLESNSLRIARRNEDRDTVRAVYWHDWPRYALTVQRAFSQDNKKRGEWWTEVDEGWPAFVDHTRYFLQRSFAVGSGHEAIGDWIFGRPPPPTGVWELGPLMDGYRIAPNVADQMSAEVHAVYQAELAGAIASPPKPSPGDPATLADLAMKRRIVEKHGGKLVIFIAPFVTKNVFHPKGPEIVLDFSDPNRFAELYEPRHRADRGHVNSAGSRIFTEMLAREFLASRPK